jgi:hypothetical protein
MYEIELGQNDTDYRNAVLYQNSIRIDLTTYTVTFKMENDNGDHFEINCVAQLGNTAIPKNLGGVRIPFSVRETAIAGLFHGKFYLKDVFENVISAPTSNSYISVMIWEAVP